MKERFAKVKARRAENAARVKATPAKTINKREASEEQAAFAIYQLRILLGDILALLDACNSGGRAGVAKNISGRNISRECLMSAVSLLNDRIASLNIGGAMC